MTRSYESVKAEVTNLGRTLLTTKTEYYDVGHLHVRCPCGWDGVQQLNNLRHRKGCKNCRKKNIADTKRLPYSCVKSEFAKRGWTLIEREYLGKGVSMEVICPQGHKTNICWNNFQQGQGCWYCAVENLRGEGNPNWNPDKTQEEREQDRQTPEYVAWRDAVYKRDKYTCQCCNAQRFLNAHHIRNYSSYIEGRYDVGNGITLCAFCHENFHNFNGKTNNTQAQLDEFIELSKRRTFVGVR